jgi:hypothetical protein
MKDVRILRDFLVVAYGSNVENASSSDDDPVRRVFVERLRQGVAVARATSRREIELTSNHWLPRPRAVS